MLHMINNDTPSQVAAWYHSQILRIPHGNQNPTKRYLTDDQLLSLFEGKVIIQEKADGKMRWNVDYGEKGRMVSIYEDMTGKHTPHDHVMKYTNLPADKRIFIESMYISHSDGVPHINSYYNPLAYAKVMMYEPTIDTIHALLETFAKYPSHFGSDTIEGIVVKNYEHDKGARFGKWINDAFEEGL